MTQLAAAAAAAAGRYPAAQVLVSGRAYEYQYWVLLADCPAVFFFLRRRISTWRRPPVLVELGGPDHDGVGPTERTQQAHKTPLRHVHKHHAARTLVGCCCWYQIAKFHRAAASHRPPLLCGPPGVARRWRGCSSVAKPSDKNLKREIPTGARYPPSPVGGNEHQIGDGSGAAAAAAAVALGPCSSPLAKEWDVFTHST